MNEVQNAVWKYNNIRPHWALNLQKPEQIYKKFCKG